MNDTWIGLRDEDLSETERRARDASDVVRRRRHEAALSLGAHLSELPDAPAWTPSAVRARGPTRWVTASLAMVGAALLIVPHLLHPFVDARPDGGVRTRGGGSAEPGVVLRAVAEGAGAPRSLREDDVVHTGERVVFEVETGASGTLTVDESDATTRRVWPVDAPWKVDAGRHFLGGDHALAWHADTPGVHGYVATFCPSTGAACVTSTIALRWASP